MRKVIIICKICHRQWEAETIIKNSHPIEVIKCNDCMWKEWVKKGLVSSVKKNG